MDWEQLILAILKRIFLVYVIGQRGSVSVEAPASSGNYETFDYFVKGRFHSPREPLVYDAEVVHRRSRIQGSKRHTKSATGAIEHAVRDCVNKMKAGGVLG